MPRKTYERGRDYGQPRQRLHGKKFQAGDRIRFKPDRSLGTVLRATAYTLTVAFDDGEISQISPHEVVHSVSLKHKPRIPNKGVGVRFTFHGMFKTKAEARRKEQTVPGSFIREKDGYYLVLKPKGRSNHGPSAKAVPIYGRCIRIEATKTWPHDYNGKPSRGDQHYFHDFETKNAMIYGLPDGSLLIKAKK